MDSSTIVWIVVAVIIVLAIAALIAAAMRKKRAEKQRTRAQQLRQEAVSNVDAIDHSSVAAKEAEARAERARLEAERAERQAQEAQRAVDMERATYEDRIREADRLDPDVDHRTTDPYRHTEQTEQAGTEQTGATEPPRTTY